MQIILSGRAFKLRNGSREDLSHGGRCLLVLDQSPTDVEAMLFAVCQEQKNVTPWLVMLSPEQKAKIIVKLEPYLEELRNIREGSADVLR